MSVPPEEIARSIGGMELAGVLQDTDMFEVERVNPADPPEPNLPRRTTWAAIKASIGGGHQRGDVVISVRALAAPDWLPCGSVQLQATYPDLFALVGLIGDYPPGALWASVSGGTGRAVNSYAEITRDKLIGVGNNVIWRSSNGGTAWTSEATAWNLTLVESLNSGVYAGGSGVLLRSADQGATFSSITTPSGSSGTPIQFAESEGRLYVVYSSGGLWYSDDFGSTWTRPSGATNVAMVGVAGNGLLAAFLGNNTNSLRSADNGTTWVSGGTLPANGTNTSYRVHSKEGVVSMSGNGGIMRTADGGVSWTMVLAGTNTYGDILEVDGRLIVRSRSTGAPHRYSDNMGATWGTGNLNASAAAMTPLVERGRVVFAVSAGTSAQESSALYGYNPATQFRIPQHPAKIPLQAYIKA